MAGIPVWGDRGRQPQPGMFTDGAMPPGDVPDRAGMKKATRFQNTISSLGNLTFGIGLSAAYPSGQSITGTRGGGIFRIRENS